MSQQRRLLQGGAVISLDDQIRDFARADVLIEGDRIAAVGPNLEVGDAELIDAHGMIVLPGLVDAHRHLWEAPTKVLAGDLSLAGYFGTVLGILGARVRAEDAYAGNLLGALECLDAGITTVLDWSHALNTPEHADASISALKESHVRAVFSHGPPGNDVPGWWVASDRRHPGDVKRLRNQYFSGEDGLIRLGMSIRGPEFATIEATAHDIGLARELDVRAYFHVGCGASGRGAGAVTRLQDAGLLGDDLCAAHCNTVSDEELRMLVDAGVAVTVTPVVEMLMAIGTPVGGKVRSLGGRPSLGADVVVGTGTDLFRQMQTALVIERGLANQQRLDAGEDCQTVGPTVREILLDATVGGAAALGLEDRIGTLTPGKQADIIMLHTARLNAGPLSDPVGTVVLGADTANVDTVIVAGRVVKRGGELVNVDQKRLRQLAQESQEHLLMGLGRTAHSWATSDVAVE